MTVIKRAIIARTAAARRVTFFRNDGEAAIRDDLLAAREKIYLIKLDVRREDLS